MRALALGAAFTSCACAQVLGADFDGLRPRDASAAGGAGGGGGDAGSGAAGAGGAAAASGGASGAAGDGAGGGSGAAAAGGEAGQGGGAAAGTGGQGGAAGEAGDASAGAGGVAGAGAGGVAGAAGCAPSPCCGDGLLDAGEQCDGTVPGSATCASALAPSWTGNLACQLDCYYDTTACSPPSPTTWGTLGDLGRWTKLDLTSIDTNARGYRGGAFDGRYVYFSPSNRGSGVPNGVAARYDTNAASFPVGWSLFDTATIATGAKGYVGGAYDGLNVYFVPHDDGGPGGTIARHQPTTSFGDLASWSHFDASTLIAGARGYDGAVFDGRYLYLIPYNNGAFDGHVIRYDTSLGFTASSAYSEYDLADKAVSAIGYWGGTFDGRYVYFAPFSNGVVYHGVAARYDTRLPFVADAAWEVFDCGTIHASGKGYQGAVSDGQYVYFVPHIRVNTPTFHGVVMRYDSSYSFTSSAAWTTFDIGSINGAAIGYSGGAFDGRYVYFVPYQSGSTTFHGWLARYDTQAAFGVSGSWELFDVATLDSAARGYRGAIFDGRFLYLLPYYNGGFHGLALRYDVKSPGWLPARWHASFY